jgi:hypothetical protein
LLSLRIDWVILDVVCLLNVHPVSPDDPVEGLGDLLPYARIAAPTGVTIRKITHGGGGKSRRKHVVIYYAVIS